MKWPATETIWERRLLMVYVLLMVVVVAGFFRVESLSRDIERESQTRAFINCSAINEQSDALMSFAVALREYAREQDGGDEAPEVEAARDQFLEDTEERLPYRDCPPDPDAEATDDNGE